MTMMKTIRSNVFETNSSSTHTITINLDNYVNKHLYDEEDVLIIHFGEFGWEIEEYTDFLDRASYAITLCKYNESEFNFVRDMISSYFSGITVLFKQTNQSIVENFDELDDNYIGYIDHQSYEDSFEEIFYSQDSLYNFLFSNNSYFNTDNDNH